jgi:hypothetical protein
MAPKAKQPKPLIGQQLNTTIPLNSVSFDFSAIDNLIRSQGVKLKHLRALPDPRGLTSRGDYRREHSEGNSDGLIFREAGCFYATFTSNDKMPLYEVEGEIDASTAYVTPPTAYEGTQEPIIINVFDRFEIQDIELRVVTTQLVETNATGRDRLSFPAICVEHLIGNDGYEYKEGMHFKINAEGEVEWISQTRPGIDVSLNKGEIYSIRYRYVPYFVARRLIHEVRVSQYTDPNTGIRTVRRLPYQIQISRENVFRDTRRSSDAPFSDPRFQDVPDDGNIVGGSRG